MKGRKMLKNFLIPVLLGAGVAMAAPSTRTYTANATGTNPSTVTMTGNTITVNLSSLAGRQVYAARFYPGRTIMNGDQNSAWNNDAWVLVTGNDDTLQLIPPRFDQFDVTKLIRDSLSVGQASFRAINAPGLNTATLQMAFRITSDLDLPAQNQQPANFSARFKDGDIMFTFDEVNPPTLPTNPTYANVRDARINAETPYQIRYRIYKSRFNNIDSAVKYSTFIDEVRPLSCWNSGLLPMDGNSGLTINTFPVNDMVMAQPGTGIYVHHQTAQSDTSYYFISRSVNGEETFGNSPITGPVVSSRGPGMVVMWDNTFPGNFMWESGANVRRYVKWESYPNAAFPSTPKNYLIAVPQNYSTITPSGVTLALHPWGGSMDYPVLWWYNASQRYILVSSMQEPYDWWTGYNPNPGTLKPINRGHIEPFSQTRMLSFLFDNVRTLYNIDTNRILLAGNSMGGSGASQLGLRAGHIFAEVNSMVGIHIPEMSPQFAVSYQAHYQTRATGLRYTNPGLVRFGFPLISLSDNISPWDYFDNTWWLARNRNAKFPWMTFSNGQNDGGIGWDQAWLTVQSYQRYRVPYNFVWGQSGHGQRPNRLGGDDRFTQVFANAARSLPAFTNMSTSTSIGTSPASAPLTGDINNDVNWSTDWDIDSANHWAIRIGLTGNAATPEAQVSVSPKRLSRFIIDTNRTYRFTYSENGTVLDSGVVAPDSNRNLTVNNLTIARGILRTLDIQSTLNTPPPPPPQDTVVTPPPPPPPVVRDSLTVTPMICGAFANYGYLEFPRYNDSVPVMQWPDSTENHVRVFVDSKGISVYGATYKYERDFTDLTSAWNFSRRILVPIRKTELDSLGFIQCQ